MPVRPRPPGVATTVHHSGTRIVIAHARELARSIPALPGVDVVVDTDGRAATEGGARVRELLREHDALPAAPSR